MPSQGLLVISAYLPCEWDVRFIDENLTEAIADDFRWADAVFISGMHIQRPNIHCIVDRAHRQGKLAVLGGPSVSASPESYPDVDILHVGELGDGTDALIAHLDRTVDRPAQQIVFSTKERLPLDEFPMPAYHLLDLQRYLIANIQFSSGCPYLCEFCDIPALYGRRPRLKLPEQIGTELDAICAAGVRQAVYFVDDNFISDLKATRNLLRYLVDWQRVRNYPLSFSCEATLNLAEHTDLMELMREARFNGVFLGVETPELDALRAMKKGQNVRKPMVEAVQRLNAYGMEVVAGIILGLDTDTPETGAHVMEFIEATQIPMLTINLLYALPQTPLYERLIKAERLTDDPALASNVVFLQPYHQVLNAWRECIASTYEPAALFARFAYQSETTFRRRLEPKIEVTTEKVLFGLSIFARVLWRAGVQADYRREFWRIAWPLLRKGYIGDVINIGLVSDHLIKFTQSALRGEGEAAFYAS